jgi:hypothetical protein
MYSAQKRRGCMFEIRFKIDLYKVKHSKARCVVQMKLQGNTIINETTRLSSDLQECLQQVVELELEMEKEKTSVA